MIVPFAAAGALIFYLSAVPLKIAFVLRAGEKFGFGVGVSAFEGRFARAAAEKNIGRKSRRRSKKISLNRIVLKSILKSARHILRHARLEAFSARGSVSLGDAALTALVCGAAGSVLAAVSAPAQARIECALQPDFSSPGIALAGEVSGIVSLRAGHIMLAALIGAIDYGNGRLSQWTDTRLKTS